MKTVDEPESPRLLARRPKIVAFSGAAQRASATSSRSTSTRTRSPTSRTTTSPTTRPTCSPDGKSIVYVARVSGNEKLFRLDLDDREEDAADVRHARRRGGASSSTPTRWCSRRPRPIPTQPVEPEVARNGNIYNIWTLNLKNGELRQYTDALGGNVSPIVLHRRQAAQRIGFVSYYKGEYALHTLEREGTDADGRRRATSARRARSSTSRRRSRTRWSPANKRKKGTFEKMFLDGRPPVNVGVTSGGDVFGGTADHLQRRARRQAVQRVRRVDLAVPHVRRART